MSLLPRRVVLFSALSAAPSFSLAALIFLIIHSALFLYDLDHPASFLVGDRSVTRLMKLETFLAAWANPADVVAVLRFFGEPGDYVLHALLFLLAGQYGVILTQIALELVSLLFLFWLAERLFHSPWISFAAVVVYLLLPGSIEYPHLLVTEALFNPLLIISMYYVVGYFQGEPGSVTDLIVAGILTSIAASIRILALPFAGVVLILIVWQKLPAGKRIRDGVAYAMAVLSVLVCILLFFYQVAGTLSLGPSDHSLARNLSDRVRRVAEVSKIELTADLMEDREVRVGEFISFVGQHPWPYLKTAASDLVNFAANSGINHLLGRYLNLFPLERASTYYTEVRDRSGYLGLLRVMLRDSPLMLTVNLVTSLAWAVFGLVALYGLWRFVGEEAIDPRVRIALIALVLYIVAVSQLVGAVSYRHRTPVEFVLALMVAWGGGHLIARKHSSG